MVNFCYWVSFCNSTHFLSFRNGTILARPPVVSSELSANLGGLTVIDNQSGRTLGEDSPLVIDNSGHRESNSAVKDFGHLLELEMPSLQRKARRWYRDPADAEDLLQDTIVRALASAHQWEPGTNLRAWLVTIMRNQFFTAVAQSNRAKALQSEAVMDPTVAGKPEARLQLRELGAAIARLPAKQRLAILLVAVEDKSYQEVAEAMQMTIGAVRCHLARGRARLREMVLNSTDHSPIASPIRPRVVR
jgi:RNA polymerase sigma-70 factor (ECF subfamily)